MQKTEILPATQNVITCGLLKTELFCFLEQYRSRGVIEINELQYIQHIEVSLLTLNDPKMYAKHELITMKENVKSSR